MKIKAILCAIAAFAAALTPYPVPAQDAATPTPPVEQTAPAPAPAPPTRFYLEVDQADLQLIAQAINELPKRVADPLILKLQGQLQPPAQAKIVENKDAAAGAIKDNKGIVTKGQRGDNRIGK